MSDNYEQWSQRFMLSIGENPYASPLWDNANLDEDDISVPVPGNWEILKRSPWVHYHPQNRRLPNQGWKIHTSTIPEQAEQHLSIVSKIISTWSPGVPKRLCLSKQNGPASPSAATS